MCLKSQAGRLERRSVLTTHWGKTQLKVQEVHLLLNWINQASSPGRHLQRPNHLKAPELVKKKKRWETTQANLNRRPPKQFLSPREHAEYSPLLVLSVGSTLLFPLTRCHATIWCFSNFFTAWLTENENIYHTGIKSQDWSSHCGKVD